MAKYLVIFNDQINDIEVTGFKAMTDKEVDYLESIAESVKWPFYYQLTNYSLEFSDGSDYLSRLEFREISNEEYKALIKTFNDGFGVFITEEFLETLVEEEDYDDFEDNDDYYGGDDNDKFDDDY